jgi:hypothetical protein
VDDDLVAEWRRSQPELPEPSASTAAAVGPKPWRWIAEMEELAAAFGAVGLSAGLHAGAAEVYRALSGREDATGVTLEEVPSDLLAAR